MSPSRLIPERLRESADLLHARDFRNVFLAQSVSVFGDGITPVALTWAVLALTHSGTDLGIVLACQAIPLVLLALVGGVWADRLPRARLMVGSDLVRAAVQLTGAALLLSGAMGAMTPGQLFGAPRLVSTWAALCLSACKHGRRTCLRR